MKQLIDPGFSVWGMFTSKTEKSGNETYYHLHVDANAFDGGK